MQWTHEARLGLQGEYSVGGHPIDVRLRAGLSAAGPPNALLREADIALDGARDARVHFNLFDASSHAKAVGALSLMPELRSALQRNQLSLVHQPKRDLKTGAVRGVESLVRWTHPTHGPIAPDVFVRLAEETADIYALTRWVMDRAIAEQEALMAAGHRLQFAVNLSGRLVGDAAFIDWVIDRGPAQRGALRLEITETAMIEHPADAIANVAQLRTAGIPCSIDDFGSGLASLGYLKRIDADELKLDKGVIDELSRSRRDRLITRSIVDLAHSLGMSVVAEGVESAESAALAAASGCDLAQGYFTGYPMPLAELINILTGEAEQASARAVATG
ncbi:MAG TPA: EAL domain-containing protein [Nitrolancea sp.]|nr:EAL domain-containing protein [Nitrolancea sp.]